jgi:acyl carrier protein
MSFPGSDDNHFVRVAAHVGKLARTAAIGLTRCPADETTGKRPLPLNSPSPFAIRARDLGLGQPCAPRNPSGLRRPRRDHRNALPFKDLPMPSTFDTVANIIAETCDIERATIQPGSNAFSDLGIDSLDFLDVAFAIDKTFGIKMPIEQWTQEVNDGKAAAEQYFVLKNLCARIDDLVAAKKA